LIVSEGKAAHRQVHHEAVSTRNGERAAKAQRRTPDLGVLNNHLGYFIRRIQVWVFQDFMRALASVDVRPAQYSVLAVIEANPGLSQSDVAECLGIERARFVRLLDRRSHALYLTREGLRALKRIKSLAAEHEAQLAAKLGPEKRRVLIDLLRDFGR
jgi:DNA-binding MarR family transcriptional regulator